MNDPNMTFNKDEMLSIIGWYSAAVTNSEFSENMDEHDRGTILKLRKALVVATDENLKVLRKQIKEDNDHANHSKHAIGD